MPKFNQVERYFQDRQIKEDKSQDNKAEAQQFKSEKSLRLKRLAFNDDFIWYMENIVLDKAKMPKLNGEAEIDNKKLYNIVKAEVLQELYKEYFKFKE